MSQAHILIVDDEPDIRELVREILEDEGYRVDTAENGEAARARWADGPPDLVLLDVWMPDMDGISLLREWSSGGRLPCPVVMISGHGTLDTAVEATRLGAHDFVQKPLSLAKLLATVRKALEAGAGAGAPAAEARSADEDDIRPVGSSAEMQLLRQKAEQAAGHDSPMLITGEAGSGRETLARYVHRLGHRAGPFVALDHCRLGADDARAYLFGRDGALDRAARGTLFIGDLHKLPSQVQEWLLQVVEAGGYVREGGGEARPLECRIIASAPPGVADLVAAGRILDGLYFQLNVLPLAVPALRERAEDVPDLVRFYADWFPDHDDLPYRSFSVSAQNRLRNHAWPGNIRELRNLVQRLLILGGTEDVSVAEVEEALRQNADIAEAGDADRNPAFDLPLREAREHFEREYLLYQLRKAGGSVGKLSESAGMERTHLYRKLRALGIDPRAVAKESNNP